MRCNNVFYVSKVVPLLHVLSKKRSAFYLHLLWLLGVCAVSLGCPLKSDFITLKRCLTSSRIAVSEVHSPDMEDFCAYYLDLVTSLSSSLLGMFVISTIVPTMDVMIRPWTSFSPVLETVNQPSDQICFCRFEVAEGVWIPFKSYLNLKNCWV